MSVDDTERAAGLELRRQALELHERYEREFAEAPLLVKVIGFPLWLRGRRIMARNRARLERWDGTPDTWEPLERIY